MTEIDPLLLRELDADRPATAPGLLSNVEKDRHIERAFVGMYRWYLSRSQKTRNWNPDTSFDWRALRSNHSDRLNNIVEGFFAVEQYVPDYVSALLRVIRRSHGRSHFHIRWGAEEEKHSDMWHNALLFLRFRTPQWIEDFKQALRARTWELPWDNPMHMIFYTVVQERATQVNYLNTALIAAGKSLLAHYRGDADPVLEEAARTIAVDEAAHYSFFLEGARLYLYYYPAQALEALADVIKYFSMPAASLIPNYANFSEIVAADCVYGPRQHLRDVLDVALENLNVRGRRALAEGIRLTRRVPHPDGTTHDTAIFDVLDCAAVREKVLRLYGRIAEFEKSVGFDLVDPVPLAPAM